MSSPWFFGASVGTTSTTLRFSDDNDLAFAQHAVIASVGYRLGTRWTLRGGLGAVIGGELDSTAMGRAFDMGPGLVASAGVSRRWGFGDGERWFVTGSAVLALATTTTQETQMEAADEVRLSALDLRFGAMAGRTLFGRWHPYALARVFGGPVLWALDDEDIQGTDRHHFQLGVGSSVSTDFGLSAVVDLSLLGERSASVGVIWQL